MFGQQQFAALIGFAFVAIWIVASFGDAILCLLGSLAFAGVAAYLRGELDLTELNERLQGNSRANR